MQPFGGIARAQRLRPKRPNGDEEALGKRIATVFSGHGVFGAENRFFIAQSF